MLGIAWRNSAESICFSMHKLVMYIAYHSPSMLCVGTVTVQYLRQSAWTLVTGTLYLGRGGVKIMTEMIKQAKSSSSTFGVGWKGKERSGGGGLSQNPLDFHGCLSLAKSCLQGTVPNHAHTCVDEVLKLSFDAFKHLLCALLWRTLLFKLDLVKTLCI